MIIYQGIKRRAQFYVLCLSHDNRVVEIPIEEITGQRILTYLEKLAWHNISTPVERQPDEELSNGVD